MQSSLTKVLVAEDSVFIRACLADIFGTCNNQGCNYEVVFVGDGIEAKNELLKEDSNFDIALLDDSMPEINGDEVLKFIKESERHKHIPVVMMIADSSMSHASLFMDGAVDILLKPIRIESIRNLTRHIKRAQDSIVIKRVFSDHYCNFSYIRDLSIGLARTIKTDCLVAVKVINRKDLSPHDKKTFYKQIEGSKFPKVPTIIQVEDIFIDEEYVYIVQEKMESTLRERLQKRRDQNESIYSQQILDWIACLVISLLWMHSKELLQQDIATEKIYLSKNNITKMRPWEIGSSLASSQSKSPYNLSPEVIKGEKYGQKSDIWALGCVIYEMAALRKPFNSSSVPGLIKEICESEPDPLPDNLDPIIRMLVSSMLQKDPLIRPSIWDIAEVDIIEERILKFIEKHKCRDIVEPILNSGKHKRRQKTQLVDHWLEKKILMKQFSLFFIFLDNLNRPEYLAQTIRNNVHLKTASTRLLKSEEKVVTGQDLVEWFQKHLQIFNLQDISAAVTLMIQQGLLLSINSTQEFENSSTAIYRFLIDTSGSAANMLRIYNDRIENSLGLTIALVDKMNSILEEIWGLQSFENDEESDFNIKKITNSQAYMNFTKTICELQALSLGTLEEKEVLACFLNIYQVMAAHKLLLEKCKVNQTKNILKQIRNIFSQSDERVFVYRISSMDFTLEDVLHGVLRGNKKSPNSHFSKIFHKNDPRHKILQVNEPRILFALQKIPLQSKLIAFKTDNLEQELDRCCKEYLSEKAFYDPCENELHLPEALQDYKEDLGNEDDLIHFVYKYNKFAPRLLEDMAVVYQ